LAHLLSVHELLFHHHQVVLVDVDLVGQLHFLLTEACVLFLLFSELTGCLQKWLEVATGGWLVFEMADL